MRPRIAAEELAATLVREALLGARTEDPESEGGRLDGRLFVFVAGDLLVFRDGMIVLNLMVLGHALGTDEIRDNSSCGLREQKKAKEGRGRGAGVCPRPAPGLINFTKFDGINKEGQHIRPEARRSSTTLSMSFGFASLISDLRLDRDEVSRAVELRRAQDPYLLTSRVVMCGSTFSEGNHLYLDRGGPWQAALGALLGAAYEIYAREGADALVIRDLPTMDAAFEAQMLEAGVRSVGALDQVAGQLGLVGACARACG